MSLWRGILQQRRDEWTSSLRGLDGIEAKPEIYNENIPVFKHHGARLINRKELRSEEDFLKDFTPFICKKTEEEKARLRGKWLGSNTANDGIQAFFDAFFGGAEAEAVEAYEAQDDADVEEEAGEEAEASVGISGGASEMVETTTSIADIMFRLDAREAGEGSFAPGAAGATAVEGVPGWERGSLDTPEGGARGREGDLGEIVGGGRMAGEIDAALASVIGQLKALGITTREGVRDALERAEATIARIKAEGIKSQGDRQALIEAYRLEGNIYTVLGRAEEAAAARLEQAHITRFDTLLTNTPEYKSWNTAVNPSTGRQFTHAELKEYYKEQMGASRNIGLAGRSNKQSMYELLIEKGIKPPSRAASGGGGGGRK